LLHADAESDSVAALFKGKAVHFATEEDFRSQAPGAAILHVAAHAFLNVVQPSLSAVIFAPSPGQDGLLHVKEIPGIDLSSASLVVLAACDSGFGPGAAGDEISSLNRSFLIAGAASVVSSLWKIHDAGAAQFMQSFYSFLSKGELRADALRHAQDALRADYEHPFYWAAFTLTGDPGWR
jgi:CHAT domain-containing protein